MTGFAATAALAIGAFLFLGSYTRRAQVVGQLVPTSGLSTVLAPATGVVSRMASVEGPRGVAGETLAVVSVPRATVNAGDTTVALEQRLAHRQQSLEGSRSAQRQLFDTQAGGRSAQLAVARRELTRLETEITTRQGRVRIAAATLQRLRQLRCERYVSELQVEQQETQHLQAIGDMQLLQRQATATRRDIAQLRQALRELPGQRLASQSGYQRDLALLEQERVETRARGALVVSAPVSGLVATQLVKPGQAVQAGQPLLTLLPGDGRLEAELWVPSRAIGFIEPGDQVWLRYQAYPYQKFGHQPGTVARISRNALNQGELQRVLGGAVQGEPMYRVTVALARQAVTALR